MLDSLMVRQPVLRGLQSSVAGSLYQAGVRANSATMISGILGVLAGIMFARSELAIGNVALAVSGGLDAVDGTIAREFETATRVGGILDLTLDRIVEVAVLLGLIWNHPPLDFAAAGCACDLVREHHGLCGYRRCHW
jgi:phosphatidylglycerophosphate synthase